MTEQNTPTGAEPRVRQLAELAGLRRRLASMLYESLLLIGVLALTFLVPLLMLGIGTKYTPSGGVLWVYIFVVLGAYFLWYWRRGGQTLAMQTWKLKIVNINGGVITLQQGWLRYALAWPSVLFFGAGLIWALFDREHQFLHDRLAGTRIVLLSAVPQN
jgi:uncharacterized RDD family membrane protein YckC